MERGGVENTKKKGMAGERGWCLKTPGGFERGLDLSDAWLKLNWPARTPARQVCELLGQLDACLLLMDTRRRGFSVSWMASAQTSPSAALSAVCFA